jgi:hypothetical protein
LQLWVALVSGVLGTIGAQIGVRYINSTIGAFLGAFLVSGIFFNKKKNKKKKKGGGGGGGVFFKNFFRLVFIY